MLQIQSKICVITSQTLHLLYLFPFRGCPISLDRKLFPSVAFVTFLTISQGIRAISFPHCCASPAIPACASNRAQDSSSLSGPWAFL